jgi:hypothetical protein
VKVLEAGQKLAESPEAAPVPAEAPIQSVSQAAPPPEPAPPPETAPPMPAAHDIHGIRWRGFAEVDYKVLNQRVPENETYGFVPGSAGSFYTGDFNLFLTSKITARTSALAEIDFEEGDAQTYTTNLRRILLKYDADQHLKLSVGRYQTSVGYYNWEFRSATWLQTTADRPLVMEFSSNGGILPTQAVGLSATGAIPSGKLNLNYIAEYGSSDTIRPHLNGDGLFTDENNGNQANLAFYMEPDALPGVRIGSSIYHDRISALLDDSAGNQIVQPTDSERWNQTIVNGYGVYVGRGIEFLNEGFLIRQALMGSTEILNTPAFYSQISKQVHRWRPFFRYQYVNASQRNPFYEDVGLRFGPSVGTRYDLNDYLAFKAQFDHTLRRGLPNLSGLHLQLSATF